MDISKENPSSPSSRRRWDIWLEVLTSLAGMLAASLASLSTLSELRSGFTSIVVAAFAAAITVQTFLVTRHYRRATPAQELKEQVRKAYADALRQLPTKSIGGNQQ